MRSERDLLLDYVDRYVARRSEQIVELLTDLVRRPSVSGREGRHDDTSSLAGAVYEHALETGCELDAEACGPDGDNIIQVLGSNRSDAPALLFEAHSDTVPAGDERDWLGVGPFSGARGEVHYLGENEVELEVAGQTVRRHIRERMAKQWEVRNERRREIIYGRGSFDNKAATVIVLETFRALQSAESETGLALAGTLLGAHCVREETDGAGARALAWEQDSWLRRYGYSRAPGEGEGRIGGAIVLEGSYSFVPVIGNRGSLQVLLSTRGTATHAATPELGTNAVLKMARILAGLDENWAQIRQRLRQGLDTGVVGDLSIAVGTTIAGGEIGSVRHQNGRRYVERQVMNAVPSWCEATLDVRYPPSSTYPDGTVELPGKLLERLRASLMDMLPRSEHDTLELEELTSDLPCLLIGPNGQPESHPLVVTARRCTSDVLGRAPEIGVAPGGTDAAWIVHGTGWPALVEFGPGGGLSHQPHEYVEVEDVLAGIRIMSRIAIEELGIVDANPRHSEEPTKESYEHDRQAGQRSRTR